MSRQFSISVNLEFASERCISCGVDFALASDYRTERKRDHRNFYCPNGHSQYYPQETAEERLRKELEAERKRRSEETSKRWEAEAKILKMEKRVKSGVCQCCKRTFTNVARHMKSKHPEFPKSEVR